jgi:hypothetical protein
VVDRHGPRQVGDEDERALQDRDEDEILACVVLGDLRAELLDPRADLALREIDLPEPRLRD